MFGEMDKDARAQSCMVQSTSNHHTSLISAFLAQDFFAANCKEVSPRQTAKICCDALAESSSLYSISSLSISVPASLKIWHVIYCFWKTSLALIVMAKEEKESGLSVTD